MGLAGDSMPAKCCVAPVFGLLSVVVAVPASAADWSQFYIGAGLGADVLTGQGQFQGQSDDDDDDDDDTLSGRGSAPIGGDLGVSITAGADYQLNRLLVAGAFVTYDWSNIDTSASITDGVDFVNANLLKIDHGWTVGGRLGVLATSSTMIYGLLGYSSLELDDITVASTIGANFTLALPDKGGWTVGGGFEHKLNHNVSLRGEYRYTDFGKETVFNDPAIGTVTGDSQNHTARLVAAYRFGGNSAADEPISPQQNWSGVFIGGGIGVDAFVRDLDIDIASLGVQGRLSGLGGGGFGGHVIAGYDVMATPSILMGAFGSYDWSTGEFDVSAGAGGTDVSAELLSLDRSWTVGARAGVPLGNDVLLYGLLGYTRAQFNDATVSAGGGSATISFPELDGICVGGGFEKMLTGTLSLRAEYRYTSLEDAHVSIVAGAADMTIDSSIHSAKLSAIYRFSGIGSAP